MLFIAFTNAIEGRADPNAFTDGIAHGIVEFGGINGLAAFPSKQ